MLYLAMIAALLFAPMPANAETITGVTSVIDGDTIEVWGQRIRLHDIDAPESRQLCIRADGTSWRCGQQAALALSDRIGRQQVSCPVRDTDRFGRAIAVCVQDGSDLNAWVVQQGWAVAYCQYSRGYIPAEEDARRSRRNVWSGQFDISWDWRRAQRGG
ncbi:thermonuclease family protein [Sulfitobacter sp.]|uniref:thermonuclease family protein n=1 Tax=Sulfitobacter sp. TaxID=1903071 RepID=UPI0030010F42